VFFRFLLFLVFCLLATRRQSGSHLTKMQYSAPEKTQFVLRFNTANSAQFGKATPSRSTVHAWVVTEDCNHPVTQIGSSLEHCTTFWLNDYHAAA